MRMRSYITLMHSSWFAPTTNYVRWDEKLTIQFIWIEIRLGAHFIDIKYQHLAIYFVLFFFFPIPLLYLNSAFRLSSINKTKEWMNRVTLHVWAPTLTVKKMYSCSLHQSFIAYFNPFCNFFNFAQSTSKILDYSNIQLMWHCRSTI